MLNYECINCGTVSDHSDIQCCELPEWRSRSIQKTGKLEGDNKSKEISNTLRNPNSYTQIKVTMHPIDNDLQRAIDRLTNHVEKHHHKDVGRIVGLLVANGYTYIQTTVFEEDGLKPCIYLHCKIPTDKL